MPRTTSTKKKIFHAAIDCFSEMGYRDCTMQDIASLVGIKASSLYKHFVSKEQILQEIFEYYKINFNKYRTPVNTIVTTAASKPVNEVLKMLFYTFGTEAEYAVLLKIGRIMMNLQCKSKEARKLFQTAYIDEPAEYLHTAFIALIADGRIAPFDYEAMTFQMLSFSYMLFIIGMMGERSTKETDHIFHDGIEMFAKVLLHMGWREN